MAKSIPKKATSQVQKFKKNKVEAVDPQISATWLENYEAVLQEQGFEKIATYSTIAPNINGQNVPYTQQIHAHRDGFILGLDTYYDGERQTVNRAIVSCCRYMDQNMGRIASTSLGFTMTGFDARENIADKMERVRCAEPVTKPRNYDDLYAFRFEGNKKFATTAHEGLASWEITTAIARDHLNDMPDWVKEILEFRSEPGPSSSPDKTIKLLP
jgi:hypothetical protein